MDNYADELSGILSTLKENPRGLSVSDIAAKIGVNRNTVSRYLDMLRISGQVDMKTYGKAKVFFISQRAPVSAMLNFSSDMVAVIDNELKVVQVNDSLCSLLNVERSDIIGKELRDSPLVGFDHPVINDRIRVALEGEETVDEIKIVRIDDERYYRIRIIPTVLNDSSPGITLMLEDTTEQHRAREALLESEHNFRSLVEEINDAIWNIDTKGVFLYASPKSADIIKKPADELIGLSLLDYLDDVSSENFLESMREAKTKRTAELTECTLIRKNSPESRVKLELSICPKFDNIGDLTGYRVVCRDISVRDNAMKSLFKWKSFLNSIVQNIPSMVLVKEVKFGTYIFFNKAAEEFFDLDNNICIGKMGCELFPDKITEYFVSGDREVLSTLKPAFLPPITAKSGSGERRDLSVRKVPISGPDEKLEYIMTIAEDVTEQNRAKEEIIAQRDQSQSYLDVAGVMIAVVNKDGMIESLNKKGCFILGYTEDEILGADWFSTVVPQSLRADLKTGFEQAINGDCIPKSGQKGRILRKDGTEAEVVWHNTFLKNAKGEISAMVSSASEKPELS
ncbi:PAS domain-containing protein [Methanomicrobium antiquum]|uniref:PAS domain-containing protein n=1 Tax=Methanomicrobium antiquum TaxID=487686 RepID=A0AAF0JM04_9EURY|nr:PAS domain-containing protein [Methanomicrobium antiquum]MDD3977047.1 PAS domain-containing protein [Methanomicrobium sp.]WFN36627.1 PAS domain-containing protein [Methanomicrobium antiquum]